MFGIALGLGYILIAVHRFAAGSCAWQMLCIVGCLLIVAGEVNIITTRKRRRKAMRLKAKSKDDIIEGLEAENLELSIRCCDLKTRITKLESQNKDLEQELLEVRERYADLLDRYIKTMERTVKIDEQRDI